MKRKDFQTMSVDELWALHETIGSILTAKMEVEKSQLEKQLDRLRLTGVPANKDRPRRAYPKVQPKYRNPENPRQQWSGRGRQPLWVTRLLAAGKTLDDLLIE
jgi:DNA-binding protein H-NS